jgi:hypothetical protein
MGLLRTIAIILIVYYAFKLIGRYVLPLFVKRMVDNVEKKYKDQQQNFSQDENAKVGETVIDKKPSQTKGSNKDVGDYVDYEEIND